MVSFKIVYNEKKIISCFCWLFENTVDYRILTLHQTTILIHLLILINFLWILLKFLCTKSNLLQKMTVLLLPFQLRCPLFLFLTLLWCLVLKILCWIKEVRMGIPVLFLRKSFQFFTIGYGVSFGFVIYGLYYIGTFPIYPLYWKLLS